MLVRLSSTRTGADNGTVGDRADTSSRTCAGGTSVNVLVGERSPWPHRTPPGRTTGSGQWRKRFSSSGVNFHMTFFGNGVSGVCRLIVAISFDAVMKPVSRLLCMRPIACPSSCTAVRIYGAGAAPARRPCTRPHMSSFGNT